VPIEVVDKFGIISFKKGSEILLDTIVEKPEIGTEPSKLASYGRYLLKNSIFKHLNPQNTGKDKELWTVDAITELVGEGKDVIVQKTQGEWMTTGDPENYFKAHLRYVKEFEKYGDKVVDWVKEME